MIQLIKGSIFDTKCDLLIIPCDNMGGVTSFVHKQLMVNDLPYYQKEMLAGDVQFFVNTSSFANASMIGYAASVDAAKIKSDEVIIAKIAQQIKAFCLDQALNKVNIPLLGTGAGGLSYSASFGILEQEFQSSSNILLCVYCISDDIYNQLSKKKVTITTNEIKNPRVFISYTGTDYNNRKWVKDFACRLRDNGVDARIDIFHLKPGQDLPQWMTNELIMADKVLLICDKYYAEKADNRKGGVGWETMIIQGDMLSKQEQNKYVAILRDKNMDRSLPLYVKSKYALNWVDDGIVDKEFEDLLLYLFDCDTEPPIGAIPLFVKEKLSK